MRAVGAAETGRSDAGRQDRIIGRMEHAIAQAGDYGERRQSPEVGSKPVKQHRDGIHPQSADQHPCRTEPIDDDTGRGLHQPRGCVHQAHHDAELGIPHAERTLQQREQWRQHDLVEMAHEMRRADEADDSDVLRRDGANRHAAFHPVAETVLVGGLEVRAGSRHLCRIALAGPDQQRVLESDDGPLPVLRSIAGQALPVRCAQLHMSGGPFFRIGFAGQNR